MHEPRRRFRRVRLIALLAVGSTFACEEPGLTDLGPVDTDLALVSAADAANPVEESAKLIAPFGGAAGDFLGLGVAIAGDQVIVGASHYFDGFPSGGAAFVHTFNGTSWDAGTKLTHTPALQSELFGHDIGMDGTRAIIAAPGYYDGTSFGGGAFIFELNGTWSEAAVLLASDRAAGALFGGAADVSGDVAIVGDTQENDPTGHGKAYIYRFNGSVWQEEAILTASDGDDGDKFGRSVSIDGDHAIVGANAKGSLDEGGAYVFHFNGSTWDEVILTASGIQPSDEHGISVAIDGDRALVGAYAGDGFSDACTCVANVGTVYYYERSGTAWIENPTVIRASDAAPLADFGYAIDLEGDRAAISARIEGTQGAGAGALYVFNFDGSAWNETEKFVASDGAAGDRLGRSIGLSGDRVIGGAWLDDNTNGIDAGAAYVFEVPPPDPVDEIGDLADFIVSLGLPATDEADLTDKLDDAVAFLNQSKTDKAVKKLRDFIKKVQKKDGESLTAQQATDLETWAEDIIGLIESMP